MGEYEARVLNYCREHVLPEGDEINEDLEMMREERVIPCVEDGIVGEWIYEACVNADYLTEERRTCGKQW